MLKNFLKSAFRNFLNNKISTLINISGLIIGITCCLIIYTKINYELSFDTFHSDTGQIYRKVRITSNLEYLQGDFEYRAGTFYAFPKAIRDELPDVEVVTPVYYWRDGIFSIPDQSSLKGKKNFKEEEGLVLLEPEFFKIFDFKKQPLEWITGNPENSLKNPYSVVLTKTIAEKYFPGEDPIGKTINLNGDMDLTVSGLISDFPKNSNFPFTILVSFSSFTARNPGVQNAWYGLDDFYQCFVKLKPNVPKSKIEQELKEIHGKHRNNNMVEERLFKLQPLSEIHQDKRYIDHNYKRTVFPRDVLLTLSLIAIFLVLIVSINYNNMAIAISTSRSKEVAVRKVMGSNRKTLIFQFFGESFILTFIAVIIGLIISIVILKLFYNFFGLPYDISIPFNFSTIILLIGFLIVITFLSGLYPALIVSGFKPTVIFQKKGPVLFNVNLNFSKTVVLLQFIIAQVTIIGAILIYKQLYYINNTDIGFQRNGIITVQLPENNEDKMNRFKNQLLQYPEIVNISYSSSSPAVVQGFAGVDYVNKGINFNILSGIKFIDTSYISTYEMQILHGKNISNTNQPLYVIVNEELLKEIGITEGRLGIGEIIKLGGRFDATIVGVVKDFHTNSLHERVRPSVLAYIPDQFYIAGIKFKISNSDNKNAYYHINEIIKNIKNEWQDVYDSDVFEYSFLDEKVADYYVNERKFAQIVNLFTILIIFICSLGIVGLSFYTIKKKNKEIAIKKVNGALIHHILYLISREYLLLVLISLFIAAPVAFMLMSKWLNNFAYKTNLSWWIFALAGIFSLIISLITISWQSMLAAKRDPIEALRYE